MKKILQITQCLSGGGAAREVIYLASQSMKDGLYSHKIVTLAPSTGSGLKLADEYKVPVINMPSTETLHAYIEDADIVQVNWWNNPEITRLLQSYMPDCRLIIRYHVSGHTPPQCIVKEHFDMADYNIISYNDIPLLNQYDDRWKRDRIELILHGTDLNRMESSIKKPHSGFNVGYIGTVSFVKMHPEYVKMSNSISIPDVKFIICGNIEEQSLLYHVKDEKAENKFDFKGYVDNIGEVISVLDVFGYPLCPDTYASTDLVLQEVMYAGVPAVVFNYGGLAQTVKNGFNGFVVDTPAEYKQAIEFLYNNPYELEAMGNNARAYIIENLGIKNTANQYYSIYEKVLTKKKIWHEWGKDSCKSLLDQPISFFDVFGEPLRQSTSELFISSLGAHGRCFAESLAGDSDHELLFAADEKVAQSSHTMFRIGIAWYRAYDMSDAYLHFWSGLILFSGNNSKEALKCWAMAHENGFDHWRLYWYMTLAFMEIGKEKDVEKLVQYLSRIKPAWRKIVSELYKPTEISEDLNRSDGVDTRHYTTA